jgi:hypothetical protein
MYVPLQRHLKVHWIRKDDKRLPIPLQDDIEYNQPLEEDENVL